LPMFLRTKKKVFQRGFVGGILQPAMAGKFEDFRRIKGPWGSFVMPCTL
jgi:hypothetical protein